MSQNTLNSGKQLDTLQTMGTLHLCGRFLRGLTISKGPYKNDDISHSSSLFFGTGNWEMASTLASIT